MTFWVCELRLNPRTGSANSDARLRSAALSDEFVQLRVVIERIPVADTRQRGLVKVRASNEILLRHYNPQTKQNILVIYSELYVLDHTRHPVF